MVAGECRVEWCCNSPRKFYLKREIGDASGFFTLVFKKVKGKWYIISDHTS